MSGGYSRRASEISLGLRLSAVGAAAAYGLAEGVCDAFVVAGGTFLISCGAVTIGRIATGPL